MGVSTQSTWGLISRVSSRTYRKKNTKKWSTSPKPGKPIALLLGPTKPIKSPSTKKVKNPPSAKVGDVTTGNNPVMVVRPNPSSTKRPRRLKKIVLKMETTYGKDKKSTS